MAQTQSLNPTMNKSDKVLEVFEDYLAKTDDVNEFVDHVKFLGFYLANSPCLKLYSEKIESRIRHYQLSFHVDEISKEEKTLHVATQLYQTGGHTRVIENWINFLPNEDHDILLTEQHRDFHLNLPSKTQIIKLDNHLSNSQKIKALSEIYPNYSKVIFHTHQHDAIPFIAIGTDKTSKYYFYNHADHTFSIGASLVSEVYDMSSSGQKFSLNFRGAKSSKVIPFPLKITEHIISTQEKINYRKELNLPLDSKIVITVGNPYKFIPNSDYNLFEKFEKIASKNQGVIFLMIGPDESFTKYLKGECKNILMLGLKPKESVLKYYKASDFYIDSLPIGGGLALIEAILTGLPVATFDNGFNAFDAAEKFRIEYSELDNILLNYLSNETKTNDLAKNCYQEASKHTFKHWSENFSTLSKRSEMPLSNFVLEDYCKKLASKYPETNLPRSSYKISNEVLLKISKHLPLVLIAKIVIFQQCYSLIITGYTLIKDKMGLRNS